MNTMTNAMTWDAIAADEGSEIEAISETETDKVSGGNPALVAYAVIGAVTFAVAYGAGYWANRDP